ncbi:TIGR03905 family TSCPD domain-containing protein [Pelosinus sp. sgz500959]|uniref:TIGR03905 family TSCPD domain-containing protein n=1 Tax=Pelosinus sp. sgz500959 TaxID=3242472 RepID=UPI003671E6AE
MATYNTEGVCAKEIDFDLTDGIVSNVRFKGGCPGNLQAISSLIEGMPAEEVIKKVKGIKCGNKTTSCTDQLANALLQKLAK